MTMKMSFTALGAAVLGAIMAVLLPALWRGAPESVVGEDVRVGDVALEAEDVRVGDVTLETEGVRVGDVTAEALTAFAELCSRRRETTPSMIHVAMADPSTRQEEVEDAWAEFDRLCVAGEESGAHEVVRQLDSIRGRVMEIERSACGPEFGINWPYHLGMVRSAEDSEEMVRYIRAIDKSLSYYEYLAARICGLRKQAEEKLDKLDERNRFNKSNGFRNALVTVSHYLPDTSEMCAVMDELLDRWGWRWDVASICPRAILLWVGRPVPVEVRSFLTLAKVVKDHSRAFAVDSIAEKIRSRVCVRRFTRDREYGSMLFTERLPGWNEMESSDRRRLYDLFNSIADAVNSKGVDVCAVSDFATFGTVLSFRQSRSARSLLAIADDVAERKDMDDRKAVEDEAVERFAEEYAMEHYVGRQLEVDVNLERIYSLEYYDMDLTPEDVSRIRHDRTPLYEVVDELIEDFKEMVKEDKARNFERWKLQLEADTQIEEAAIDAGARIEEAKIDSAVRRYEANVKYKTELAKIRAQERARPGFFGKLLGAVTGMLGSDAVAKGVVDLVVPKPPAPAPPPPGGTVERTTTTITTTTPDGKSIERTETESEKLPLGGR